MKSVHGNGGGGGGLVVMELSHIKELVTQLQGHLGSSPELCRHLAAQISTVTERSISLITSFHLDDGGRKRSAGDAATAHSPLSDASGGGAPFKTAKKRKTSEKKRHQVRVSSAGGDNPVDDGHSWRKYGQKEILGAKNPRAYYRCTHRHSKGCAATKQVQRADEDPTLIDVVYLGEHTCCGQRAAAPAGQAATTGPEAPEHGAANSPLQSLSSDLTVKVEGLAVEPEPEVLQASGATTPFYLLSTPPTSGGCLAEEQGPLSVPSTSENWDMSPATSDSNNVVPFPAFEAAGDLRFGFEEVVSAFDEFGDDVDIDISSFFA
ncbi:hypothetical protein U9M48_014093 [Paspalum notatum var. saurae]|uniref:WRKY domain-containing protein n=1 Tax=Paspalum notatum var. saurae TaxID=547442 RepID=A0AAQ3T0J8_PASNO